MFGLFTRRAALRDYSNKSEVALAELFGGFPSDVLPSIRNAVNVEAMQKHFFGLNDCSPTDCAVLVARRIIGAAISQMDHSQRQAAIASITSDNPTHPLHFAIGHMNAVAKQMTGEGNVKLLMTEVMGRLHGWSEDQIEQQWAADQADRIGGMLKRGRQA